MLSISRSKSMISVLALVTGLTACAGPNQKAFIGAGAGGITAFGACMLARGNAGLCAAIGVAAAVVGGAIGHELDERDKAAREAALNRAFVNQNAWASVQGTGPAPSPQAAGSANSVWSNPDTADATTWNNPDTGDSGTITPVNSYSPAAGQVCHEYVETYTRNGSTTNQPTRACQGQDGQWTYTDLSSSGS